MTFLKLHPLDHTDTDEIYINPNFIVDFYDFKESGGSLIHVACLEESQSTSHAMSDEQGIITSKGSVDFFLQEISVREKAEDYKNCLFEL